MLLSIVMMVKDEEKFIYRTLEALKPLMENIESELIILDTGSTDNTVNIAKEFTEKVYFSKWNDDFADMRNKSLGYAKGKWILVIDADEVLTDYSKLLEFLENDIYKEYDAFQIRLKNYTTSNLNNYVYLPILRFFRNGEIKYSGAIHEQPVYKKASNYIVAEFDHYGYVYEDEQFREKKCRRNEKILLEELSKNSEDEYINYQLGKNLMVESKYEEALKYIEKSKKIYDDKNINAPYVYSDLCKVYTKLNKNKKLEEICEFYLKNRNENNLDINFYLADAKVKLNKFEEAITYVKKYIFLVDNYEKSEQSMSIYALDDNSFRKNSVLFELSKLYIRTEKYEEFLMIFPELEYKYKEKIYSNLFESLLKNKKIEHVLKYRKDVKLDKIKLEKFYFELESFIKTKCKEEKNTIYEVCSRIEDNYGMLNKLRISQNPKIEDIKKILKNGKNDIYGQAILLALENNQNIFEIVIDLDYVWVEKYIKYALEYDNSKVDLIYSQIFKNRKKINDEKIRLNIIIIKQIMKYRQKNKNDFKKIFYIYNLFYYKMLKNIYINYSDKEIVKYTFNNDDRFHIEFRKIIQYKERLSMDYIDKIKGLISEYPLYNEILDILIEEVQEEIKLPNEFNILKVELLKHIETMIIRNEFDNASNMLEEYCNNFKVNEDILNMGAIISINKNKIELAYEQLIYALSLDIENKDVIYNIEHILNM